MTFLHNPTLAAGSARRYKNIRRAGGGSIYTKLLTRHRIVLRIMLALCDSAARAEFYFFIITDAIFACVIAIAIASLSSGVFGFAAGNKIFSIL